MHTDHESIDLQKIQNKPSKKAIRGGQGSIEMYKQGNKEFVVKYMQQEDDYR